MSYTFESDYRTHPPNLCRSEYIPETPNVTIPWCPGCEPEKDPLDFLGEVCYCAPHKPSSEGQVVPTFQPLDDGVFYQSDAGGQSNRDACNFIHRGGYEEHTMTKYLAPAIAVLTAVLGALSPQIHAYVSAHPQVTIYAGALSILAAAFLPQPNK